MNEEMILTLFNECKSCAGLGQVLGVYAHRECDDCMGLGSKGLTETGRKVVTLVVVELMRGDSTLLSEVSTIVQQLAITNE